MYNGPIEPGMKFYTCYDMEVVETVSVVIPGHPFPIRWASGGGDTEEDFRSVRVVIDSPAQQNAVPDTANYQFSDAQLAQAADEQNAAATPTNQVQMAPQFYGQGGVGLLNAQAQQAEYFTNAACYQMSNLQQGQAGMLTTMADIKQAAHDLARVNILPPGPRRPRGKDADCTAHDCDRIRELGVYANRAGLCTMHVAQFTGENGGRVDPMALRDVTEENESWEKSIRRQMRERPEPQLVVGGLWRTRPEGMR